MIIFNCNNSFAHILGHSRLDLVQQKFKNYFVSSTKSFYLSLFQKLKSNRIKPGGYKNQVVSFVSRYKTIKVFTCNMGFYKEDHGEAYITLFLKNFSKKIKLEASVMIDKYGEIIAHSSSCSLLFNLPTFKLSDSRIERITDIVENFELNKVDDMEDKSQKTFNPKTIKIRRNIRRITQGQKTMEKIEEKGSLEWSHDEDNSQLEELKGKFTKVMQKLNTDPEKNKIQNKFRYSEEMKVSLKPGNKSMSDLSSFRSNNAKDVESSLNSRLDTTRLKFSLIKCDDCENYICKFWRKIDAQSFENTLENLEGKIRLQNKEKTGVIYSSYFQKENVFMFTLQRNLTMKLEKYSCLQVGMEDQENEIEEIFRKNFRIEKEINFVNYGKGIQTKRLINGGFIRDILEFDEQKEVIEEIKEQEKIKKKILKKKTLLKKNTEIDENKLTPAYQEKALANIKASLRRRYTPGPLKNLITASILYISINLIEEIYSISNQKNLINDLINFSIIEFANGIRASNIQEIHARVRDIALINNGSDLFMNYGEEINIEKYQAEAYHHLLLARKKMMKYSEDIYNSAVKIEDKKDYFLELINKPSIQIRTFEGDFQLYSLQNTIQFINSEILTIKNIVDNSDENGNRFSEITFKLHEIQFLMFNTVNFIVEKIEFMAEFGIEKQEEIFQVKHPREYQIFKLWNCIYHPFFLITLLILVIKFQKSKEKIVDIILGFDSEFAKSKAKISQHFLIYIQAWYEENEDDMENESMFDHHSQTDQDDENRSNASAMTISNIFLLKNNENIFDAFKRKKSLRKRGTLVRFGYLKGMFICVISLIFGTNYVLLERDHEEILEESQLIHSINSATKAIADMRFLYNSVILNIMEKGNDFDIAGRKADIMIDEYIQKSEEDLQNTFQVNIFKKNFFLNFF